MSKSPIESAIEETQRCLKAAPVIVLGSGASAPYGLPTMRTLGQHLVDSIDAGGFTPAEQELWTEFKTALATKDLESALHAVKLSEPLSKSVICKTWALISKADTDAFHRLITNANLLAITRLYRYLFDCVHRTISVVTTNYDRLAEYGADAAGVCHYTGFTYGYLRDRQPANRVSFLQDRKPARTVEIWKVHGSIDWFADATDRVIGLPPMPSLPAGMTPAIVTPGIEKFERTHAEPFRSILAGADDALTRARAYLCIGYGFNDTHIQPKLMDRWRHGDAMLVIVTKELTDATRSLLRGCASQNFLALEEATGGTRMLTAEYPNGIIIEDASLWRLADLMDQAI